MKYKVYANCGGDLYGYKNNKEAKSFFLSCMNCSEGSERERYTTIYLELQNPNLKFVSDHTSKICRTSIDFDLISEKDREELKEYYNLEDNDINYLQANFKLSSISKRIFNSDMEKYNHDFEEYYKNQPSYNKQNKYYYIDDNKDVIVCFDRCTTEYFCEDFNIQDYDYAYKWLNNEIEYEQYLNKDQKDFDI